METQELIVLIKQSKKYKHISEEVIRQKIEDYTRKNEDWQDYKQKYILKGIKALLHSAYGSFQVKEKKKRDKYLGELKNESDDLNIVDKILKTNRSTKERLGSYEELYERLFEITGKPACVVDLGCGMNPVSVAYYLDKKDKINYYAYDIDEEDINFLNRFFEVVKAQVKGRAELINLQDIKELEKIPSCDICLMFKLVDVLEEHGHKHSEELVKALIEKCKFIVMSFATATITGRVMKFKDRGWVERMLERIGFKYEKIDLDSETFYVISRNQNK